MRLLLDTHVFLWAIGEPGRLSARAREVMEDEENELVLSVASLWEIVIKAQAGKLQLPLNEDYFREHIGRLGIDRLLPVQPTHVYALLTLAMHHKDPFDRVLLAQCWSERLALVSADEKLRPYGLEVLW